MKTMKRLSLKKDINIDSSKKISHSSIKKNNVSMVKDNCSLINYDRIVLKVGSRIFIAVSSKKIGSQRQINFT